MLTIGVLGPLTVADASGADTTPSGALQRRLLAALVLHTPRAISVDRLAEALWPGRLPANYVAAVQTHVFRIRKLMPSLTIDFEHGAYRLSADGVRLDRDDAERHLGEASRVRVSQPERALHLLETALALWRGDAYVELLDDETADAERARLGELRLRCIDERVEIMLACGRGTEAIADLEALTVAHPTRERHHGQLMRALAESGRAVDALRTYDRLRQALSAELGIEPSPELQRLHDAVVGGVATTPRPHPVAARRATPPLPLPTTPVVGRHAELTSASALLAERRLVTLVGTGGVGKTRIAVELASGADLTTFTDGVWWCDLAGSSSANVLATIANTLDIEVGDGTDRASRIASVLRTWAALLVLDNCEHVLDAVAPLVEQVLAACPGVQTLCTSRERLAIEGEQLVQIGPLESSSGDAPAVALFVDRARAVQPTLDVDAETLAQVRDLCEQLGGLPLAIELAAARLHTMTVAEIAAEIDRGLAVLAGQRRRVDRHRSLSATLRWSTDSLSAGERDGLAALAVFRGGFDTRAASAVLAVDARQVAQLLSDLTERSLLQRDRYGHLMLEPIRQFALEELPGDPLVTAGRADRHAAHFVQVADELDRALLGPAVASAKHRFDAVLPDLRAARQRLVVNADADRLFQLANSVKRYGVNFLRTETLLWGVEAAAMRPDDLRAVDIDTFVASYAWARGDRTGFIRGTEAAAARNAKYRDSIPAELADTFGLLALATGDMRGAIDWYRKALDALGPTDDLRQVEIRMTMLLAIAYRDASDVSELTEELLSWIGDPPDGLLAAWAWYGAGEAMIGRDDGVAEQRLRRSIEIARRIECAFIAGLAGASLASLLIRSGNFDSARSMYRWLLPLWERSGDRAVAWTALRSIVELLIEFEQFEPAAALLTAVRSTDEGHTVFGTDQERLDRFERRLRSELGGPGYDRAAAAGTRLTSGEAIDLVLGSFESGPPPTR